MSLDIRWFKRVKGSHTAWKCYRLTIGNSPVSQSVAWMDYICEDWEGTHPATAEVTYVYQIWSFWTYKQFRRKATN